MNWICYHISYVRTEPLELGSRPLNTKHYQDAIFSPCKHVNFKVMIHMIIMNELLIYLTAMLMMLLLTVLGL